MAYGTDIDTNLSPDHRWDFDGDSLDQVGSVNGTDTSIVYTATGICKDVTNCAQTNATGDRIALATTTNINNSAQTRKAVGGWFMNTTIQTPPKRIYGEGTNLTGFQFILAYGNTCMFEVVEPTNFDIQIITDRSLVPNRAYHLLGIFSGSAYDDEVLFFLDGVKQTLTIPTDPAPGTADLNARGVAEFGDPATSSTGVGEQTLTIGAGVNFRYNEWCTWDGAIALLSDADVRVELFEKGALGDTVISAGTEAAMQTSLDGEADTLGPNEACDIEIQAVTGDGDLTLTLDNRTFDPLASIHVKYLGTGTLTLINTNGANAEQAKCAAPFGTIVVATQVDVKVTVKDAATGALIEDARVYITDTGSGVVINELTTASGIADDVYNYTSDEAVTGYARKGTSSPLYIEANISTTIGSSGFDITVLMVKDE